MYAAQTLPFPKLTAYSPQTKNHPKVTSLQNPPFGFLNSGKRVSESRAGPKKGGSFAAIMCAAAQDKRTVDEQDKFGDDGYYMRRCVELAKKAIGSTSPNPMVGCVIVNGGKIVGQGFHPKAGQPHAEVFALRDAGDLAENGTAYVSLEPCNHYGRTPPCTEALIKAKVKKVVIGMVDPNPLVASAGVKKLQDAGIQVTVGVEEEMCKRLNEVFVHHILTGKSFVTLRYSMSLDGHILYQLGEEATECDGYYSKLLQEYDAVILSSTTLAEKSSFPFSNEPGANQPAKIILSTSPNSQIQIPIVDDVEASKLTIVSDKDNNFEPQTIQEGIIKTRSFEKISLREILEDCKSRGQCSVLIDLRGNNLDFEDILKEGFELNLFQKVVVEVLPLLGGDREHVLKHMDLKSNVRNLTSFVSGKSVILEGYF
ncbi:Riboflavin biosynthesis protein PYRD-chloroplastic [Striga hermonthica]|uniref:Riboflavin biosynthesis protein PYRD, chloroplastic n=1 Tax=Striga hermonthica TaxID=68872 RepID=A0A9N7RSV8_STRHE|nr:Riboflavin biosynthesis protein PYRD-chloroplastic [Striga hermonthica]